MPRPHLSVVSRSFVSWPFMVNLDCFDAYLHGVLAEDCAASRYDKEHFDSWGGGKAGILGMLVQDTEDQFRVFGVLVEHLQNPRLFTDVYPIPLAPDVRPTLIARYYAIDVSLCGALFGTRFTKHDLEDVLEELHGCTATLHRCRAVIENVRRVCRTVCNGYRRKEGVSIPEEVPVEEAIASMFLLHPRLAKQYAVLAFGFEHKIDVTGVVEALTRRVDPTLSVSALVKGIPSMLPNSSRVLDAVLPERSSSRERPAPPKPLASVQFDFYDLSSICTAFTAWCNNTALLIPDDFYVALGKLKPVLKETRVLHELFGLVLGATQMPAVKSLLGTIKEAGRGAAAAQEQNLDATNSGQGQQTPHPLSSTKRQYTKRIQQDFIPIVRTIGSISRDLSTRRDLTAFMEAVVVKLIVAFASELSQGGQAADDTKVHICPEGSREMLTLLSELTAAFPQLTTVGAEGHRILDTVFAHFLQCVKLLCQLFLSKLH